MHPQDQKQNRMFPVRISRVLKETIHLKPASNIFPGGSDSKASAYDAGDLCSIPGWGRSPGEGNGNPLQYFRLENPMDRGARWATVDGVAKSRTQLSDFPFPLNIYRIRGQGPFNDSFN